MDSRQTSLQLCIVAQAKTGVHHFHGDNNELGTACGRYYRRLDSFIPWRRNDVLICMYGSYLLQKGMYIFPSINGMIHIYLLHHSAKDDVSR